ncbi:hypothetical protein [Simplicispira psychrophila]|uniref:hypothetical protein n=1 Tax=Simplicispira psychrophila TaxID=80882 RepID=UPI000482B9BF|nr:hypothetical protein [Simplicispira psychrophila]
MSRTLRWAWVALFLLLAMGAVVTNMNSRRILVLHEGAADSAAVRAFGQGVGSMLGQVSHLKLRQQYLGFDLGVCHRVLDQLRAFDPDAVIAEGLKARQCLDSQTAQAQPIVVSMPETPSLRIDQGSYVAAWAKVLADIAPPGGLLLALPGDDQEGQLEYRLLGDAARRVGLRIQSLGQAVVLEPRVLANAVRLAAPDMVFVGRTLGAQLGAQHKDTQDKPQTGLLQALRRSTPNPILASRLESLELGADLVLLQAPEQRGELLAQATLAALARGTAALPEPTPPYEMAVGLRQDFVARQHHALPSFYVLSARLAGFLTGP